MNFCPILYMFRPIRVTFGSTDVHNRSLYDCVSWGGGIGTVKFQLQRVPEFLLVFTTFLVQFA